MVRVLVREIGVRVGVWVGDNLNDSVVHFSTVQYNSAKCNSVQCSWRMQEICWGWCGVVWCGESAGPKSFYCLPLSLSLSLFIPIAFSRCAHIVTSSYVGSTCWRRGEVRRREELWGEEKRGKELWGAGRGGVKEIECMCECEGDSKREWVYVWV